MTTDQYAELRAALALGPTEGYEYDSNQTPFYNDPDGFSRGGNCDGTYYVFAPSFTVPGDEYEYDGPVLTERTSEADAKFICAANPEAIRALLAERDALREALSELVACRDIKRRIAVEQATMIPETDDDFVELDRLMTDLANRQPKAWAAADALTQQEQGK